MSEPICTTEASNMEKTQKTSTSDRPAAGSLLRRHTNCRRINGSTDENQHLSGCGQHGCSEERPVSAKKNRKKATNCKRRALVKKSMTAYRKWSKPKSKINYKKRTYLDYVKRRRQRSRNSKNQDKNNASNAIVDMDKNAFSRAWMTAATSLPYLTWPVLHPYFYAFTPRWCGVLNMLGFAKCPIALEPIRGFCYQFSHLMETELHVVGGIKRAAVWECLENIKKRGRKKVGLVLVKPANCNDVPTYGSYFEYFARRRQIGHISYRTEDMSFFLLLPMCTGKRLKTILMHFQTEPIDLGYAQINFFMGIMLLKDQDEICNVGSPLLPPMSYPYMTMLGNLQLPAEDPPLPAEDPPLPAENPPEKPLEPE